MASMVAAHPNPALSDPLRRPATSRVDHIHSTTRHKNASDRVNGQRPATASTASARAEHERKVRHVQPVNRDDNNLRSDKKREQRIGDFIIKRTLGKGSFSKVCLAEHRKTKQTFALKFIKPKSAQQGADKNDKHDLRVEREIKASLTHVSSQCRQALRCRAYQQVHHDCHGTQSGRRAPAAHSQTGSAGRGRGPEIFSPDCISNGLLPQQLHHSSRPETGERNARLKKTT